MPRSTFLRSEPKNKRTAGWMKEGKREKRGGGGVEDTCIRVLGENIGIRFLE